MYNHLGDCFVNLLLVRLKIDVYGDIQIEESLESLIALQCKWLWLCSKTIRKLQIGIYLQASLMFKQMLFKVEHLLDRVSTITMNDFELLQ